MASVQICTMVARFGEIDPELILPNMSSQNGSNPVEVGSLMCANIVRKTEQSIVWRPTFR